MILSITARNFLSPCILKVAHLRPVSIVPVWEARTKCVGCQHVLRHAGSIPPLSVWSNSSRIFANSARETFFALKTRQHELLGSTGERPIEEISHKTQLSFLDRNSPNAIPSSQEDR